MCLGAAQVGARGNYHRRKNTGCRNKFGELGSKDKDYTVSSDTNLIQCRSKCSRNENCPGFQWHKGRCELWKKGPMKMSKEKIVSGHVCYIKRQKRGRIIMIMARSGVGKMMKIGKGTRVNCSIEMGGL